MKNQKPFVDFMIVGAMKSGTTSLANILKSHPKVGFCSLKEPQFFSESPNWREELTKYKSLFPGIQEGQIVGDASTGYTMYPEFNKKVWHDIYDFNPQMKIIYIMRDPVARVISHYIHSYMRGYTRLPLNKAIIQDPAYINRTRYYTQISPYINLFGRKQVLLITFEKFLQEKDKVLLELSDFLKLDNEFKSYQEVHSNKAKQEIDITLNRHLRKIKSPYLKRAINFLYTRIYKAKEIQTEATYEIEEVIWKMLELDIINIEKEIGRKLTEWPSCLKFRNNN
ncbi:hypothetical protein OKW21_006361 [Catalinimonas alkaloidigena]|uniref:sulfotransferase family protein n=1 Tax=Catalinimonas alkaloidigena TaxID=1075417 RepID=UPI0024053AAE|nr:sulfotransferase [Catalinimonas alkaloidigena]MDF9801098.1 hypothetical protein [Catalinimonas alkaloidigena]